MISGCKFKPHVDVKIKIKKKILRWRDYPVLSRQAQGNGKGPYKGKKGEVLTKEREGYVILQNRDLSDVIAGFEDGRGLEPRNAGSLKTEN